MIVDDCGDVCAEKIVSRGAKSEKHINEEEKRHGNDAGPVQRASGAYLNIDYIYINNISHYLRL